MITSMLEPSMMTTDPDRKCTPARRQLVVVTSNHLTGRRIEQSTGWPEHETRGSVAERGRPRLAAIAPTECPSSRRRLGLGPQNGPL